MMCIAKNHTLGMDGGYNCKYHVELYVVSNIDALRDENVQVSAGVFTYLPYHYLFTLPFTFKRI